MTTLLSISAAAIDWPRAQFALTAIYHWLFVPLTLGLAVIMAIAETCYYRTGKTFWKDVSRFWQKLFGVNFAMGVATGIILEFEFGTNWSNYSWMVGDIFGAPLAIEGIVAFFMESTFVAVMFFGWDKVSRGFHLASTWLTGLGATISAWWILVANAWMQYPVGQTFNPDTMRFEMTSFAQVALSPFAVDKFCHTVTTAWIIGAVFTLAVSGWYLLKNREVQLAHASIKIGAVVGLVASLLAGFTGDNSAYMVSQTQPMKLAAMEALYNGGKQQSLTGIALLSPFSQPDYQTEAEPSMRIAVPYALSVLATHSLDGYVPGVNNLLNGYSADGKTVLSAQQRIASGKKAISLLKTYRVQKAQADRGNTVAAQQAKTTLAGLKANMPNFGYGYLTSPKQLVPHIPTCFYSFRIMVGMGCLFILFFALMTYFSFKNTLSRYRWPHIVALVLLPLAYVASEAGWILAEVGRQPWTIQDMLPVNAAVSGVAPGSVMVTFFIFLVLFTTMLAVEISILCKQIKRGPSYTSEPQVKQ